MPTEKRPAFEAAMIRAATSAAWANLVGMVKSVTSAAAHIQSEGTHVAPVPESGKEIARLLLGTLHDFALLPRGHGFVELGIFGAQRGDNLFLTIHEAKQEDADEIRGTLTSSCYQFTVQFHIPDHSLLIDNIVQQPGR